MIELRKYVQEVLTNVTKGTLEARRQNEDTPFYPLEIDKATISIRLDEDGLSIGTGMTESTTVEFSVLFSKD
jgi:hypothetical protein